MLEHTTFKIAIYFVMLPLQNVAIKINFSCGFAHIIHYFGFDFVDSSTTLNSFSAGAFSYGYIIIIYIYEKTPA